MLNNKNWIVIGLAGVLLVTTGSFMFFSKDTNAPSQTGTPGNNEEPGKVSYTLTEVSSHNSASDCWMAIGGKVYNVTDFVGKHPGGPSIIGGCGKDATVLFNERPTNDMGPHPKQAEALLETFYIGDLK
jgi:cytochrome b involved in lipid metabolism